MSGADSLITGNLILVGCGKMGEALLAGFVASKCINPGNIVVVEPSVERRVVLEAAYGVRTLGEAKGLHCADNDVCLIAVKPQVLPDVLEQMAPTYDGALLISIAAGITTDRLESMVKVGTPVVRVMPNLPATVGQGMSLISAGSHAGQPHLEVATMLFDAVGLTAVISEDEQNAGTALSGSGPAYFALLVDSMAQAGVAAGLQKEFAQQLALQTMRGTAAVLQETGQDPQEFIQGVCSPGGTTIQAIQVFEQAGLRQIVDSAIQAAIKRAEELGE